MLPHKTILFDKSIIIGLSLENFKSLSYYFSPFIIPPLIDELIEELGKGGDINDLKKKLQILSVKCIPFRSKTITTYDHFLLANLMGESIPLDGRIPVNRGIMVRHKDGTTAYIMEESEDVKTLRRWSEGKFSDSDIKEGQKIRRIKNIIKEIPKTLKELDTDLDSHLQQLSTFSELGNFVDERLSISEKNKTEQLIEGLYSGHFHNSLRNVLLKEVLEKWKKQGALPLSQYASYAFYCLRLSMIYNIGIKCNLIKTSKAQNTYFDLQYIYYLPFCHFFSSSDNFHKDISSIFLRSNQKFLEKKDLEKNSSFIKTQKQADSSVSRNLYKKKLKKEPEKNSGFLKHLLHRANEGIRIDTGKSLKTGKLTKKYDRLTLKEKSLEIIFKIQSMFELQKNDWKYVKKNLNSNHIKEFYEFYGDIWRPDSDIFKYYETEKYSSFVLINYFGTHKIVLDFIFSLSIYFDGFYIFDFLKNPWFYNKDYNPISSPKQYLGDSLKDFAMIHILQHFIVSDHIKILPLPSEFIKELNKDIILFGDKIKKDVNIDSEDEKIIKKESLEILFSSASRTHDIKGFLQNELKTNIDQKMIDTCKFLRDNDPFTLDQSFNEPELIMRKSGTPETAYIISRLKGLPVITNSKTVQNAFIKNNYIESNIWTDFANKISSYEFKIIPEYSFLFRDNLFRDDPLFDISLKKGLFKEFHLFLREVFFYAIYFNQNKKDVDRLTRELTDQLKMLDEQWEKFETNLIKNNKEPEKYIKKARLYFTIKPEGFKMLEADKWIEKYMKDMNIQKSTVLIYADLNI